MPKSQRVGIRSLSNKISNFFAKYMLPWARKTLTIVWHVASVKYRVFKLAFFIQDIKISFSVFLTVLFSKH